MGWFVVLRRRCRRPPCCSPTGWRGAFLMAMKRYSEFRRIGDPARAGLYRAASATTRRRRCCCRPSFYALLASFLLGVFLVKYRIEYLLSLPLFALLFTWYLAIALRADSAAQAPEKLHKEGRFMAFVALLSVSVAVLTFLDLPVLHVLMEPWLIGIGR